MRVHKISYSEVLITDCQTDGKTSAFAAENCLAHVQDLCPNHEIYDKDRS